MSTDDLSSMTGPGVGGTAEGTAAEPSHLQVNGRRDLLGLDGTPVFAWRTRSPQARWTWSVRSEAVRA